MTTRATTGGVRRESTGWGWLMASGVLGVLLGILALIFPGLTLLTAAVFLGIGLIVQGALEIGIAVRGGTGSSGRIWLGVFGVLTLVAGILVLFQPAGGLLLLAWGLTLWFLVAGVHDLSVAFSVSEHRGWNIGLGIISILVALILLFSPGTALGTIALIIALGFLFRGGADIGLSLSMRRAAVRS